MLMRPTPPLFSPPSFSGNFICDRRFPSLPKPRGRAFQGAKKIKRIGGELRRKKRPNVRGKRKCFILAAIKKYLCSCARYLHSVVKQKIMVGHEGTVFRTFISKLAVFLPLFVKYANHFSPTKMRSMAWYFKANKKLFLLWRLKGQKSVVSQSNLCSKPLSETREP